MRKATICILLLIISLTFLLSGCIEIDVDTGIDMDFTAYLSYRIALDVAELDELNQEILKHALNQIGWHYQENLGFIVELNTEGDHCLLIMTRRVQNNTFEQAFKSLEDMLTDEDMTIFMQVDMALQSFDLQKRYLLSAATDIPQIMRLSNAEELAPELQEQLSEAMEAGEGTITLLMPASEQVSSSHQANIQNNRATMTVPLSFTERTDFELAGILNLRRDGTPGGTIEEIVDELTTFRQIAILACGAAIVLLLIILILIFSIKRRKAVKKYYPKHEKSD